MVYDLLLDSFLETPEKPKQFSCSDTFQHSRPIFVPDAMPCYAAAHQIPYRGVLCVGLLHPKSELPKNAVRTRHACRCRPANRAHS